MNDECAFCSLIATGSARWVAQTPDAVAFAPLPEGELAPGHTLVAPREHCVGVLDAPVDVLAATMRLVQEVSRVMTRALGATGVVVLNASGPHSGQSVDHLHVHVVPCWPDDDAEFWPTDRSAHPSIPDAYEQLAREMTGPRTAVTLRPWHPDDAAFLVSLMTDPAVRRFVGGPVDVEEAAQRARRLTAPVPDGYFVVEHATRPVGTVTLDRKRGPWEVSFQLATRAWGKGVMSAALVEAVAWFRDAMPGEPLIAVTQAENGPARRTIERAGGRLDGEFEQYGAVQLRYLL